MDIPLSRYPLYQSDQSNAIVLSFCGSCAKVARWPRLQRRSLAAATLTAPKGGREEGTEGFESNGCPEKSLT